MPIYAPTLPPRPDLSRGDHPILVLLRFDLRRILRLRLGRFFGFGFAVLLLIQLATLYVKHLVNTSQGFAAVRDFANQALTHGPAYQADRLGNWLITLLWFQVALVAGGLVARDTLYRVRPLMYAHPLTPRDYLVAKGGLAALLPLAVQLPFIFLPWLMSLLIAGPNGPIWVLAPLRLVPAALLISALMGTLALGASSLAATPRAGVGWVLGISMGTGALGGMLAGLLNQTAYLALSPAALTEIWPKLLCGVPDPLFGWGPALAGTAGHLVLWTAVAWKRTRPSEAVL